MAVRTFCFWKGFFFLVVQTDVVLRFECAHGRQRPISTLARSWSSFPSEQIGEGLKAHSDT